jgi:hypothetical protein
MKRPALQKIFFLPALAFSTCTICNAQHDLNAILTAVPMLTLTSNARIGAIGEIATVSSSFYQDAGLIQNPALLSKNTQYIGGNTSFRPLLKGLWSEPRSLKSFFSSLYLTESNIYGAINQKNALGYRFAFIHIGEAIMRDENGEVVGTCNPYEYYHQITYSHTFNDQLSAGAGIKYIRSRMGWYSISGSDYLHSENAVAVDLGIHYNTSFTLSENILLHINAGAALNNFGTKIRYTSNPVYEKAFLPTCLNIAVMANPEWKITESVSMNLDIAYQIEKLLVPTQPLYNDTRDTILKGRDPDVSVFTALYSSFYDAPGGFSEEMHEILHKIGTEFRLNAGDKYYVAYRAGMLIEHKTKGNRQYTTLGMGLGFAGFSLDSKYIAGTENTGLNKTWAITLGYCRNLDHHKEDQ